MIENFQLAAVAVQGSVRSLRRVPMTAQLQATLAQQWTEQLAAFRANVIERAFDPGYTPEAEERSVVTEYSPPQWLDGVTSESIAALPELGRTAEELERVRGMVGFGRVAGAEVVLFQNFTRSHILRPGSFVFLQNGIYRSVDETGLSLADHITGVYEVASQRLVFRRYRPMNTIVPLMDLYREASDTEIREVLSHESIAVHDITKVTDEASQFLRKRFALLKDSTVLNDYTPRQLKGKAGTCGIEITIRDGRLVYPEDKTEARRFVQFLCEEIYRGPITNTVFSTNSKQTEEGGNK